jgi:hypothetical protein
MAYQLNKTDGTIIATVPDGQIDQLSTDITLIGKNYSGFGESLNENLIKMLENFSATAEPRNPIRGQLWYDTSELKLKIYNGLTFYPVSAAIVSDTQPTTLAIGDLWFDSTLGQLYFFNGTTPVLLGPAFSKSQGTSGFKVDSILDTLNQIKVITMLYTNGILLGIFSKDEFVPKQDIVGYTGSIKPGFNVGSFEGLKFNVTCTNAEMLGNAVAGNYFRTDTSTDNVIQGKLVISNNSGVVFGTSQQASLTVTNDSVSLSNSVSDRQITINVRKSNDQENAIVINSADRIVELYPDFLESTIRTGGDVVVGGNLTVEGTTTTINTSNLVIKDKTVVIANSTLPTDASADGAGIIIKGDTDKSILYDNVEKWFDISESINIQGSNALYIGGSLVINGNSLGSSITSIPGVTTFGKQSTINIGPGSTLDPTEMRLENHRISTVSGNLDIELEPNGNGNIALIGNPKITGLLNPTLPQDASTKEYVDNKVEISPLAFSMDLSDNRSNSYIRDEILSRLAPPSEFRNGKIARILCTIITNNPTSLDINNLPPDLSTAPFLTNLTGSSSNAVTNITFPVASVAGSSVTTSRIIKEFMIVSGVWAWQSETLLT